MHNSSQPFSSTQNISFMRAAVGEAYTGLPTAAIPAFASASSRNFNALGSTGFKRPSTIMALRQSDTSFKVSAARDKTIADGGGDSQMNPSDFK